MHIDETVILDLIKRAEGARKFCYAPYSNFCVGAALLCEDGEVFTGCNVESMAFTPTSCAERTAFFKAISEGKSRFSAIAIVGAKKDDKISSFCAPCGVCRQLMAEFCDKDKFLVILYDGKNYNTFTLKELLPHSFNINEF